MEHTPIPPDFYNPDQKLSDFLRIYAPGKRLKEDLNICDEWCLEIERGCTFKTCPKQAAALMWCCKQLFKSRWPAVEYYFLQCRGLALWYAGSILKTRWPEAEEKIAHSYSALRYADFIVEGPWEAGEPAIARDPANAVNYAIRILNGRFLKGEDTIAKSAVAVYMYTVYIIKDRWEQGEAALLTDPAYAALYAINVLEQRWFDAEEMIFAHPSSTIADTYCKHFNLVVDNS